MEEEGQAIPTCEGGHNAASNDAHVAISTQCDSHGSLSQDEIIRSLTDVIEGEDRFTASSSRHSSRHSAKPSGSGFSESASSTLTSVDESSLSSTLGPTMPGILPPPPRALEPVYEPETPLARRPPRRPLPTLPTGPRFTPLHSPPAVPSSHLVLPISEGLTTAAEEKRAYARARGLDELFETVSLSSETTAAVPIGHTTDSVGTTTVSELPEYVPGSGTAGLARIRSMVKRDQRLGEDEDTGEAEAARIAVRQQAAEQALRQIELDAADSKAAIARRVEEEERTRRNRALAEADLRSQKERDSEAIDEIEGLDDPPPPHEEALASTSGGDMLPLSNSKAQWPTEPSEPQPLPTSAVPSTSRLPPPPLPAPTDYFSVARAVPPSMNHPPVPIDARCPSANSYPVVQTPAPRRSSFRRESSLYPSGVEPFAISNVLRTPAVEPQQTDAPLLKDPASRTHSLGAPTSFYSTNVGLALDRDSLPASRHNRRSQLAKVSDSRFSPAEALLPASSSPASSDVPAQRQLQNYIPVPAPQLYPRLIPSGISRARSESSVSSVTSARSAPSALYASVRTSQAHRHLLSPAIEGAAPAFYTAITPDGPLLPFYAAPSSTVGGPTSYFTPSCHTSLPFGVTHSSEPPVSDRTISPEANRPARAHSVSPFTQPATYTGTIPQTASFFTPSPAPPLHGSEADDSRGNGGGGSVTSRMGTMRRLLGRRPSSNIV